jgi:hypothetical protein
MLAATVEDIKTAIELLPKNDYAGLRSWFSKRDWQLWDKEIEDDSREGKLDFLIKEALQEKEKGELRQL